MSSSGCGILIVHMLKVVQVRALTCLLLNYKSFLHVILCFALFDVGGVTALSQSINIAYFLDKLCSLIATWIDVCVYIIYKALLGFSRFIPVLCESVLPALSLHAHNFTSQFSVLANRP